MKTSISAAAIALAVCACVLTLKAVHPAAFQPHRWTWSECQKFSWTYSSTGTDWITAGKILDACVRLGQPMTNSPNEWERRYGNQRRA